MIGHRGQRAPNTFTALVVILPWFAAMGAYVNGLRRRLAESNRRLTEAVERIEVYKGNEPPVGVVPKGGGGEFRINNEE